MGTVEFDIQCCIVLFLATTDNHLQTDIYRYITDRYCSHIHEAVFIFANGCIRGSPNILPCQQIADHDCIAYNEGPAYMLVDISLCIQRRN